MKLYIVESGENGEGGRICGIYTSREKALEAAQQIVNEPHFLSCDWCSVTLYEEQDGEFVCKGENF